MRNAEQRTTAIVPLSVVHYSSLITQHVLSTGKFFFSGGKLLLTTQARI
jgi:hypothetical protein